MSEKTVLTQLGDHKGFGEALTELLAKKYTVNPDKRGKGPYRENEEMKDAIKKGGYDLAIIDISETRYEGIDLAKLSQKNQPQAPIVYITNPGETMEGVPFRKGRDDHNSTPLIPNDLIDTVERILED